MTIKYINPYYFLFFILLILLIPFSRHYLIKLKYERQYLLNTFLLTLLMVGSLLLILDGYNKLYIKDITNSDEKDNEKIKNLNTLNDEMKVTFYINFIVGGLITIYILYSLYIVVKNRRSFFFENLIPIKKEDLNKKIEKTSLPLPDLDVIITPP